MKKKFIVLLFILGIFPISTLSASESKESKRVERATEVLLEISSIPDKKIPEYLFGKAEGIAIIPNVIKGAMGFGGRWGLGLMVVRTEDGTWSDPSFISLTGGSVGWQIGGQSTDFVLIFRTKRSVEGVSHGKFTLGADASVTAGPVGRNAEASTDVQLKSEIFSYAKSRGLFAGVSIEGASLRIDNKANENYYKQKNIKTDSIFAGRMANEPSSAAKLIEELNRILVLGK